MSIDISAIKEELGDRYAGILFETEDIVAIKVYTGEMLKTGDKCWTLAAIRIKKGEE